MIGIAQFSTTQPDVEEFIDRETLTFPNVYDPAEQIATQYRVEGVPSYVFLDRQGRIAEQMAGARGAEALAAVLDALAQEETTP